MSEQRIAADAALVSDRVGKAGGRRRNHDPGIGIGAKIAAHHKRSGYGYTSRILQDFKVAHETAIHGRVHFARDLQRSEEHTSELQSLAYLVCRLLLEKKK